MRTSTKTVTIKDYVVVEKQVEKEVFRIIYENKDAKRIDLTIDYTDNLGGVIETKHVEVESDFYELLMSESPSFAPGKPANEYREIDLWYIVDRIQQAEASGVA